MLKPGNKPRTSDTPTWLRITNKYLLAIASGELRPLDKLPTHEHISREERASHTSVTKAYRSLCAFGVVEFSKKAYRVRAVIDPSVLEGLKLSLLRKRGQTFGTPQYSIDKSILTLAYHQIADQIAVAIQCGVYAPGDRLPTVVEMSKAHSIDRGVFAKAYILLQKQGMLRLIRGHGTFVNFFGGADARTPEFEQSFQNGRDVLHVDVIVKSDGTSASSQIFIQIANAILSGDMPPSIRLPQARTLARHLGVSASKVHGAYRQLVHAGAVDSKPPRGYYVKDDPDFVALRIKVEASLRRVRILSRAATFGERPTLREEKRKKQAAFLRTFEFGRNPTASLRQQIRDGIRREIIRETLRKGDILPSTALFAKTLRVSRGIVLLAYRDLAESEVLTLVRKRWIIARNPDPSRSEALKNAVNRFEESVCSMLALGVPAGSFHELCDRLISWQQSRTNTVGEHHAVAVRS